MTLYEVIASHWTASPLMAGLPVFVGSVPDNVDPTPGAGTFFLISGPPIVTHDGRNASRNEIWQLSGVAWYLYDAVAIRENILRLMDTIPGEYDGIIVQSCIPDRSPRDIRDNVRGFWMAIQEFRLFYTVVEE